MGFFDFAKKAVKKDLRNLVKSEKQLKREARENFEERLALRENYGDIVDREYKKELKKAMNRLAREKAKARISREFPMFPQPIRRTETATQKRMRKMQEKERLRRIFYG